MGGFRYTRRDIASLVSNASRIAWLVNYPALSTNALPHLEIETQLELKN
jgi:hypothetical protein